MSDNSSKKDFELVFEGIEDSSQSLQRVKGVLIGRMELSIPEVQRILENSPLTIKRSQDEEELLVYYNNLKAAGAKVLIVKPTQQDQESDSSSVQSNEIEFKVAEPISLESIKKSSETRETQSSSENQDSDELEFEFEFDKELESNPKKVASAKTYAINLDLDSQCSLEDLEKELGESLQPSNNEDVAEPAIENELTNSINVEEPSEDAPLFPPLEEISAEPETSHQEEAQDIADFNLEIMPVNHSLELIDSSQMHNDLDEKGEWATETLSSSLAANKETPVSETIHSPNSESEKIDLGGPLLELETAANSSVVENAKAALHPELAINMHTPSEPLFKTEYLQKSQTEKTSSSEAEAFSTTVSFELENHTPPEAIVAQQAQIRNEVAQKEALATSETNHETPAVKANPIATPIKHKKSKIPADILVPVIIGGILLGVANWFYFSSKAASSNSESEIAESIALIDKTSEETQPKIAPVVKLEVFTYVGESNSEGRLAKINLASNVEKITSFNLELTTPQPPALTPEEIVLQIEPQPWLHKLEVESLVFEKKEDGSFVGKGPAKAYVELGEARNRFIANTTAVIKIIDEQNMSVAVEVTLNMIPAADESRAFFIEKASDGMFHSLLKAEINLQKVVPVIPASK